MNTGVYGTHEEMKEGVTWNPLTNVDKGVEGIFDISEEETRVRSI